MSSMVNAFLKNEKSLLNKGSIGFVKIYYEMCDSLFRLDANLKRESKENPEKKEE